MESDISRIYSAAAGNFAAAASSFRCAFHIYYGLSAAVSHHDIGEGGAIWLIGRSRYFCAAAVFPMMRGEPRNRRHGDDGERFLARYSLTLDDFLFEAHSSHGAPPAFGPSSSFSSSRVSISINDDAECRRFARGCRLRTQPHALGIFRHLFIAADGCRRRLRRELCLFAHAADGGLIFATRALARFAGSLKCRRDDAPAFTTQCAAVAEVDRAPLSTSPMPSWLRGRRCASRAASWSAVEPPHRR